ncbi:hypothetical protein PsorP6_014077 [Peronosclerospora sorghi]|uniref:Uncharacterized protein n=1 Tax=Peronosclerospora sorghi TaxID=230839 RepID=A0ACC0VJX5_9STRA|nr:hypothetical protein PsorP6_014077 [Peronosclerospora sorghi]
MKTSFLLSTLATFLGRVDAHGYASKPPHNYTVGIDYTKFVMTADPSINKGFKGGIYNHAPEDNAVQFELHWNRTGYTSLRQMMDPLIKGCGNSITNVPPIDMTGETEMWWQNDKFKEGFLNSHHGMCEGWNGDIRIFHYPDCRKKFPGYPARIPFDYTKCKGDKDGKSMFRFYWIAVHQLPWQGYSTFRTVLF